MPERWLNLVDAAEALSTTPEAVRMRAKRGTLESEKRPDGRLYVRVGTDYTEGEHHEGEPGSALVDQLRSEVEYLREENRRKDSIIMQMAQRLPEIEAPQHHEASEEAAPGPADSSEEVTVEESGAEPESGTQHRRPWWRRMFGGAK